MKLNSLARYIYVLFSLWLNLSFTRYRWSYCWILLPSSICTCLVVAQASSPTTSITNAIHIILYDCIIWFRLICFISHSFIHCLLFSFLFFLLFLFLFIYLYCEMAWFSFILINSSAFYLCFNIWSIKCKVHIKA